MEALSQKLNVLIWCPRTEKLEFIAKKVQHKVNCIIFKSINVQVEVEVII